MFVLVRSILGGLVIQQTKGIVGYISGIFVGILFPEILEVQLKLYRSNRHCHWGVGLAR